MKEAVERVRPRRVPRGRLGRARRRDALRRDRLRRRRGEDAVVEALAELDEERGTARQPRLLPRRPAGRVRDDRRASSASAARAEGWTRLIVEKPFGHDLASAQRAERAPAAALRRGRDLPDRPLPRQGDRPEHAGAAVRERHLRADLEPPVHRPRPDHGRRVDRHRGPCRRSTSRRARSATSSRTTCCSSSR